MKCNSFAIAEIMGDRFLLISKLCLLPKENEEIEAEDESFLSFTRHPGAAKEPTEDIAVNVDAITPEN